MNHMTSHLKLDVIYLIVHQSSDSNLLMSLEYSYGDCKLTNCNMLKIHT